MTPSDSPGPKRGYMQTARNYFFVETELYHFEISIGCNAKFRDF